MIVKAFNKINKIALNNIKTHRVLNTFVQVQPQEQIQQFNIGLKNQGLYQLKTQSAQQMPVIYRKPEQELVENWWAIRSFDMNQPLLVPVFSFQTGEYTGEGVELEHSIFNVPLRRDIVHRVLLWRQNLYYIRTHMARNKATTAGSGKKPTPQKGQGRARRGNKRAGQHKKGGKVHGPKPRLMRYAINKKVRLQALLVMLSAKLAEGKIRIVDNEAIELPKTKLANQFLNLHDQNSRVLFIHPYLPDENFMIGQKNIKRISVCSPERLNILKLLKFEKIIMTKDALQQLIQDLQDRIFLRHKARADERGVVESQNQRKSAYGIQDSEPERYTYDPSKPISFKFQILNDYLQEYEQVRKENRLSEYEIKYK